jgi:hypothetical protein
MLAGRPLHRKNPRILLLLWPGYASLSGQRLQLVSSKLNKFITPDTKHPYFIYMMASAHALVEDNKKSLEWLTKLADMGLSYPIGSLNDFAGIKNSEEFKTALQAFEKIASL